MNATEELEPLIHATVLKVARQRGTGIERVESHHRWTVDLGLKSLDLAQVVAVLEMKTGVDPFAEMVSITSMRSVGDLVEAYRRCLAGEAAAPEVEGALEAGRDRAGRRLEAARARRAPLPEEGGGGADG